MRGELRMIIKAIKAENYTVFENTTIQFSKGINVIIGENAVILFIY